MAEPLALTVKSLAFCNSNMKKVESGQEARVPVLVGQLKNATKSASELDGVLGKGAQSAIDVFKDLAKNNKVIEYTGKAVDFASKNINPLICISAGIDVLNSDDKESALVTNVTALTSMFAVESLMKDHLDKIPKIKGIDKIAQKVMDVAKECKCEGKLPAILHGVAFVVGSCTAYSVGQKFGEVLLGKKDDSKKETVNSKQ